MQKLKGNTGWVSFAGGREQPRGTRDGIIAASEQTGKRGDVMEGQCCKARRSKVQMNKQRLDEFKKSLGLPYDKNSESWDVQQNQSAENLKTLRAYENSLADAIEELEIHLKTPHL